VHLDAHVDERERQRVAERNQLGRPLGGLDPGDARGRNHVTLRRVAARHRGGGLPRHAHHGARHGTAVGHLLVTHVDHPGAPGIVEVCELVTQADGFAAPPR
jgi:hypothetical protein